ncbi:MAG: hypothetical protein HGA85_07730 [Nanoarchaeota archaeon]|nr:hypothetical protein [Nanoarchaeota archaeon]
MTIVFGGIDLPIFEMLFIVSVLLLTGLFVMILGIFYVLKEVRELKNVLKKEEENIGKFEKGIADLESFRGGDSKSSELKNYIQDNLKKGYSWEMLKQQLTSQGFEEKKLEEIYLGIKR